MRKSILIAGLCGALTLPAVTLAPATASAACSGATTGTILGGVGGALIGNSIAHGGGGAVLGGLGGAVVGHEIGKSGCRHYTTHRYYRSRRAEAYDYRGRDGYGYRTGAYRTDGYRAGGCRTEDRDYYDANGALVRRAVQVCD